MCSLTFVPASSPSENQFLKFVSYFRGPILYVMELAVVLSAGLQDWIDFGEWCSLLRSGSLGGTDETYFLRRHRQFISAFASVRRV